MIYKPRVVIALVLYTNTQLIFRYVHYAKFKFVTDNADAKCSYRHRPHLLQTVLMETNAFWTTIVEKVVNVKGHMSIGKHMGNFLSFAIRVFWGDEFLLSGYQR